jgi:hypothetical protein
MDAKQGALAAEIRAEMAARTPRLTAVEMQRRTGIKHASWTNWFVTASRPVPYWALEAVSVELGVPLSTLLERAATRALSQLSPAAQADIARVARDLRPKPDEQPDGIGREA